MKYAAFLIVFGLVFLGEISAQTDVRTAILTSSIPRVDARGKLSRSIGKNSICFPENGKICGKRPPDLIYGFMQVGDDLDWFMVGIEKPIRTKMVSLGAHSWEDRINLPVLEPYPELKNGENREQPDIEFAVQSNSEEKTLLGSTLVKPGKILKTSSEILKAIEGHMYLLRVRDKLYDFYVLMRVDKTIPGKSVTISWKQVASPP